MTILVATKNKKKFLELKQLLKLPRVKLISLLDVANMPAIREDGKTFLENAAKKAVKISKKTQFLTLGEDSGLCVDALGGAPGIYSSRFSGKAKRDDLNNKKILSLLKGLPLNKRKAHYVCAIVLARHGQRISQFQGKCNGLIAYEEKGKAGFGYDPLFLIPAYKKTFGQLGLKVKHKISHRAKAVKKLRRFLLDAKDRG